MRIITSDLSLIFRSGCQVEISRDIVINDVHSGAAYYFTCPGGDNGNWCWNKPPPGPWFITQNISIPTYLAQSKYDNFGEVGDNKATRITCKCPLEFESIEYDTPREDWILKLDKSSGKFANNIDIRGTLLWKDYSLLN